MGEDTGIQWCHHTFNAWIGCQRVSPECDNCYADRGSARLGAQHRLKLWDDGSSRYFTGEDYWKQPARWNRTADSRGERHRIFCASYGDLFERRNDLEAPRNRLKRTVEDTPHLDWLLLSKRPENMLDLGWEDAWPENVWSGTTVGICDSLPRLMHLERVPTRIRFVSFEPLLEDIARNPETLERLLKEIAWCIIGGESGPKARPMDLGWVHRVMDVANHVGCKIFVKQLGSVWAKANGAKDRHGGDPAEWPESLRVREFPS